MVALKGRRHPGLTQTNNGSGNERPRIKRRYRLRFKFKPLPLLLLLAIISVSYQLFLGAFGLVVNYRRLAEQSRILEEKKRAIHSLKEEKMSWQSEDLIEEEARKLGMIKEGELEGWILKLEQEEELKPEAE